MELSESKINPSIDDNLLISIIQEVNDGVLILDHDGVVKFANQAAIKMFSPEIKELVGFPLTLPEDTDRIILNEGGDAPNILELSKNEIDGNGTFVLVRDITKQVALEKSLQDFNHFVEVTGETASIGSWQVNLETGEEWISDATYKILELPKGTPFGVAANKKFHPKEYHSIINHAVDLLFKTGRPYDLDVPFIKNNGQHIWIHITGRVKHEDGKRTWAWGTIQDVTEQKTVEHKATDIETHHRKAIEYSLSGFALTEAVRDETGEIVDFLIIDINQAFEDIIAIPRERAVGALASKVLWTLNGSAVVKAFIEVLNTKESQRLEYPSTFTDYIYSLSIYSPGGDQVAVFFENVSEQKKAIEALLRSEKRYRRLFNNATTGFMIFQVNANPSGGADGLTLLEANNAVFTHSGREPIQFIGSAFHDMCTDSNLERLFFKIATEGKAEQLQYYSEDLHRTLLISAYCPEKGQVAAFFSDITEQIEIQEELRKSEERYRSLFQLMTQGAVYHDSNGKVFDANPAALKILGMSREYLMNITPEDPLFKLKNLKGELISAEQHPVQVARRTGKPVEDQVVGIFNPKRKDFVWLSFSVIPKFLDGEEKPNQLFATFQDVTDTIRFQRALEERIRELNCLTNIGNILQDEDALVVVRQAVEKEIKRTMELPDDVFVRIYLGDESLNQCAEINQDYKKISVPVSIQDNQYGCICLFTPTDQSFVLPEEINVYEVIAERLGLWIQQREMQDLLLESERRFRNAILQAPNPIMIHASDGEIVTVNDVLVNQTGYSRRELKSVSDWVRKAHPNQTQEISRMINQNYSAGNRSHRGEYEVITKSGESLFWFFTSAPLGELPDGRLLVITLALDITERNKIEQEKQAYIQRIIALREIDEVITSSLDLDKVLELITTQLRNLISYDATSIMKLDGDLLRILACSGFDDVKEIMGLTFPNNSDYPNSEVINKKKPVAFMDVSKIYPVFRHPRYKDIKSWLGIPLIANEEVIGMFSLDRYSVQPYTREEIEIAQQFANRAAIAITNANLFEQMKVNLEKLKILRSVDAALTSSLDVKEVLTKVLSQVVKGLQADIAVIFLFDEESQSLKYASNVGYTTGGDPNIEIPVGQGYSGAVAKQKTPIFVLEVDADDYGQEYPFNFEKEGVASYFGFPLISKGKFMGVMEVLHRSRLEPDAEWYEFAATLAGQSAIAVDNMILFMDLQTRNREIREAYDATIEGWAYALEIRDKETEGHSRRVVSLTADVASRFGYTSADLEHILRGVILHDIGKMGVPDDILNKPGPLTAEEKVIMHQHPIFAYEMLKDIDYLQPALIVPRYHHERWNGSGYPEGLKGEDIPLEARIFSIVDAWDALTSNRPYRTAWSPERAKKYMKKQAGQEFDPDVVKVFIQVIEEKQREGLI